MEGIHLIKPMFPLFFMCVFVCFPKCLLLKPLVKPLVSPINMSNLRWFWGYGSDQPEATVLQHIQEKALSAASQPVRGPKLGMLQGSDVRGQNPRDWYVNIVNGNITWYSLHFPDFYIFPSFWETFVQFTTRDPCLFLRPKRMQRNTHFMSIHHVYTTIQIFLWLYGHHNINHNCIVIWHIQLYQY